MAADQQANNRIFDYVVEVFDPVKEAEMVFLVSEQVKRKNGGPPMVVTGYSSGMVECRWYDGFGVQREAFREEELIPGEQRTREARP